MQQGRDIAEVEATLTEGRIKAYKRQMDEMADLTLKLKQWIDDCRSFLAQKGILQEFERNYGTYESRVESFSESQSRLQKEEIEEDIDQLKQEGEKKEKQEEEIAQEQKQESMKKSAKVLKI